MTPEHAAFLAVAFATHAAVGYALVAGFTDARPAAGAVLGVAPDADFLFPAAWGPPFVHRGITHTPAVVLAVVLAAYAVRRRWDPARAAGLAVGSHVAVDALSPAGIPLLFPFDFGAGPSPGLPVHGPAGTLLLWAFAAGVVLRTDGE